MSIDSPRDAWRLSLQKGLTFPILSDPTMEAIRRYGMKGEGMQMADMGYVVIDRLGKIRHRAVDRKFGEHVDQIAPLLEQVRKQT